MDTNIYRLINDRKAPETDWTPVPANPAGMFSPKIRLVRTIRSIDFNKIKFEDIKQQRKGIFS